MTKATKKLILNSAILLILNIISMSLLIFTIVNAVFNSIDKTRLNNFLLIFLSGLFWIFIYTISMQYVSKRR